MILETSFKQMSEQKQVTDQKNILYQIHPEKWTTPAIEGYDFNKGLNYDALLKSFASMGLQSSHLAQGIEEVNKMIKWRLIDEPVDQEKDFPDYVDAKVRAETRCTIFLGYTSNMISCGTREIIRYLAEHKMIDCIVSSAGGIEEDLMKCLGTFHTGSWNVDDIQMRLKATCRIGNIFVPAENYGKLEDWLIPIFHDMYREQQNGRIWSPSQIIKLLGERINDPRSVYYWCSKNDIPVFCPAITDGAIGDMMFYFNYKQEGLICDILSDVVKINKIAMRAKRTGVIILGGGLIKHHILNANIWRNGADHAVYINTGVEHDGSDSGAKSSEGISWGKIKMDCQHVKIWAEASLVFPFLVGETFVRNFQEARRV